MLHIGDLKMRMPNGRQSKIGVDLTDKGSVHIHITRTDEGEALLILPDYAASRLGDLLKAAVKAKEAARLDTQS